MKIGKSIALTLVCIILGTIVSWQFQSISNNNKKTSSDIKRTEDLNDQLFLERKNNDNMKVRIDELQAELQKLKDSQGDYTEIQTELNKELETAELVAGMVDVKGKGLIIKLENGLDNIHEIDILRLLNELRASDVQAISINDERIVATSEIKEAGGYFLINGKQMLPPFEVKAIADPANLENALNMTEGLTDMLKKYIKIEIKKSDEIKIPKVRNDGTVIRTNLLTPVKP